MTRNNSRTTTRTPRRLDPSFEELEDFEVFYRAYERTIRATLFQLVGREHLDDLAQTAFIKCWQSREQFQGGSQLSTWVVRIALNVGYDHLRATGRDKGMVELEEIDANPEPDARPPEETLDERALVEEGMRCLDPPHRAVIALRYFQEFSISEIAEATGEAEGTVKSRLHYAKERLQRFFSRKGVKL